MAERRRGGRIAVIVVAALIVSVAVKSRRSVQAETQAARVLAVESEDGLEPATPSPVAGSLEPAQEEAREVAKVQPEPMVEPIKTPVVEAQPTEATAAAAEAHHELEAELDGAPVVEVEEPNRARAIAKVQAPATLRVPSSEAMQPMTPASEPAPEEEPVHIASTPGGLVGRVLLDAGVPPSELRVGLREVLPGQPGVRGRQHGPISLAAGGSFDFEGIAPGLCSVRFSLWGSERTLAWVDDLEVLPGEELRDARLLPLDLTGHLVPVDIELFDHVGRRLELAVVAPLDAKTGAVGRLRIQRPGLLPRLWCDRRALAGEGGLDIDLEAPGYHTRVEFVRSEELAKGAPIQFAMNRERAKTLELRLVNPPPRGAQLEARLMRPFGEERPWDKARHRGVFDANGRVRLKPAETGDFVVRVFDVKDSSVTDLGLVVPLTIHAQDSAQESAPTDPVTRTESGGTVGAHGLGEEVEVLYLPLALTANE